MKTNHEKQLKQFALISLLEGISFLILLFIAMPLKYLMDFPLAVKIVGMAHGVLFMAYVFQLIYLHTFKLWSLKTTAVYGFCSVLPFMPFWVEKKIKAFILEQKIGNS